MLSPEHMDRWTRNERLYHHLRDLGLFVVPIYSDGECPGIEYMQVATAMPEAPSLPIQRPKKVKNRRRLVALSPVNAPVKGLKIP